MKIPRHLSRQVKHPVEKLGPIAGDFWGLCRTEQFPKKLCISVQYREMTHFQLKKIKATACRELQMLC